MADDKTSTSSKDHTQQAFSKDMRIKRCAILPPQWLRAAVGETVITVYTSACSKLCKKCVAFNIFFSKLHSVYMYVKAVKSSCGIPPITSITITTSYVLIHFITF